MAFIRRLLERLRGGDPAPPAALPALPLDLLDPAFLRDPYPVYAHLRAHDPVHRTRSGAWLLTRHADVLRALGDPALGNAPSERSALAPRHRQHHVSADVAANILPFLDSPQHTTPRKIIAAAFRAHLKASAPDATAIATRLLRPLAATGGMEAIGDFGTPLSSGVMAGFLGLPAEDESLLADWSAHFFHLFAPMPSEAVRQATDDKLAEFRAYLLPLVKARRANPDDGLTARLIAGEVDGRRLSDGEIVDALMLLFADGVENVDAAIANMLLSLAIFPAQRSRLYAAPGLVPAAVDEALRHNSPAQSIARVARSEFEIGGQKIASGGVVVLGIGAANRDAQVFARPDDFDLARDNAPLLTFGKGRHSCIGSALVRLQMQAALGALVAAGLVAEIDPTRLEWRPRLGHRWLTALPVRFTPA